MHTAIARRRIGLPRPRIVVALLLALSPLWPGSSQSAARAASKAPSTESQQPDPAGLQLDDPVEPLQPVRERTGREEDHIRALALFAAGRVAEQKQDYAEALRLYERAFRFEPNALAALREIVPLAFNLNRQEEGVRYALILAERDPADASLLRRLAIYLTDDGDSKRALRFYEQALKLHEQSKAKPDANTVLMWMEMGRLYFVAKQFDQAAEFFGKVVDALEDPKQYDLPPSVQEALLNKGELTYQLFGESFLEADRPDDALAAFEKVHEIKPDDALHLYNLARVDAKKKQPAQALAKLEEYLDKQFASQGTGPYELYVETLTALGQEEQIAERLEKYRTDDQDNLPLTFFLAERYREAGQLDQAGPIYAELIAEREDRPPLEAITALLDVYRQQKNAGKLLALLGDSVGKAGSLSPLGETADELTADNEVAEAVVAAAQQQLAADPEQIDYGRRMAAALLALKLEKFDVAQSLYDAALQVEEAKPAVVINWGLELFLANQFERAAKTFQQGLEEKVLPDDNPAIYFYLAGALEMSGQTDAALEQAQKAAELKPDSPRFASRAAWIEFHAKRLDDSRKSYLELIERFDKEYDDPEARDVLRDARLVLSNIAAMQDRMDEAEEWLEQVLDEFPEDTGALNDLGYLWADGDKHLELAHDMIRVAVESDPKNMAYRDSLGWVLYRLGKYPEAIAELKVAAAVPEADGVILDHLAEAQLKSGDIVGALESWRAALSAFQRDEQPEQVELMREKIKLAEAKATEQAVAPEPPDDPKVGGEKNGDDTGHQKSDEQKTNAKPGETSPVEVEDGNAPEEARPAAPAADPS